MNSESQLTKSDLLEGIEGVVYSRKIARNTVLFRLQDGTYCVKYHNTIVVKKTPNGEITLNSGGFYTVTTKARFLEYGHVGLTQKNGVWYMPDGSLFYDGIVVTSKPPELGQYGMKTTIVSEVKKPDESAVIAMKKKIKAYTMLITPENLPMPGPGDCLYCRQTDKGISLGDATKNHDHLLSHLEEGYVIGSLIVNAMKEKGFVQHQIAFYYSIAYRGDKFPLQVIRRAVASYLQRRLMQDIAVR